MIKILGIETSCDETAVAIVDDNKNIISNLVVSQIDLHKEFGGVVPEIAARNHIKILDKLIIKSLENSNLKLTEIDAIAATAGPGLIGGIIVGLTAAKTIASIYQKPFLAINHLEGHSLTVRLTDFIEFPYLLLLLSGGHCQILIVKGVGRYEKIGETIDDALGEAFDKVGQMLGMDYPGGPKIEKAAKLGNPNKYQLPKPLINDKNQKYNFSFSGLKTAVRRLIEELTGENFNHNITSKKLTNEQINDIAASFQKTVTDILINRAKNSLEYISTRNIKINDIVISGGVAANRYIYNNILDFACSFKLNVFAPPIKLCTDNAAMIAWAAIERYKLNLIDNLDFKPKARWDLAS